MKRAGLKKCADELYHGIMVCLLIFTGCFMGNDGASLDQTEAANLRSGTPFGEYFVLIKAVDGKPPKLLDTQAALTPGKHFVELEAQYMNHESPRGLLKVRKILELEVEPSANYLCDTRPSAQGLYIWIENARTGRVVAGEAPHNVSQPSGPMTKE